MKNLFFLLLSLFVFIQCAQQKKLNNKIMEYNGNDMLVGEVNKANFEKKPFSEWFNSTYDDYRPNKELVNSFAPKLKNYDIQVFMGTWCPDSRREVPAFYHILDEAKYPSKQLKVYAVDRSKKTLDGEEEGKDIRYVPTFIFYKSGKEMGRIVESPINSLEEDINDIVNGNPQTPNYAE